MPEPVLFTVLILLVVLLILVGMTAVNNKFPLLDNTRSWRLVVKGLMVVAGLLFAFLILENSLAPSNPEEDEYRGTWGDR